MRIDINSVNALSKDLLFSFVRQRKFAWQLSVFDSIAIGCQKISIYIWIMQVLIVIIAVLFGGKPYSSSVWR